MVVVVVEREVNMEVVVAGPITVKAFDGPSRVKSKLWPSSTTSNDFIILKVVAM